MTAGAFAPYDVVLVGAGGLVAGLAVLRRTRGRAEAFLAAFAFGLGLYGVVLLWSLRFGIVAYLPLVAIQGGFVAIAGALSGGRGALSHARWVAGVTGAWTLAEAVRARWPLGGFEWAQLAQAAADLPLRHAAAVAGSLGMTGLVVALAAVAAGLVLPEHRRGAVVPAAVVGVLATTLVLAGSVSWTHPAGSLRVGILQVEPPCPGRAAVDCPQPPERHMAQFIAATRALEDDVDLMLWGEGAMRAGSPQEAGADLRGLPAPLLGGVMSPAPGQRFHNRNILFDADGGVLAAYAKRHPVPFGEYVPARRLLGAMGDVGRLVPRDMIPGTQPAALPVAGSTLGTVTSWELSFARHVAAAAASGEQAVVILTSQASYERDAVSDQFLAMASLRAVENQRSMVVAATTGQSAVVGPDGTPDSTTALYQADSLTAEVPLRGGMTPYGRVGDAPAGVVGAALLAWRLAPTRHRDGSRRRGRGRLRRAATEGSWTSA